MMSDKEHLTSARSISGRFVPVTPWERRHQARENVGLRPATILVGDVEHPFFIRNISPRGVMGQTVAEVEVGEAVCLEFESGTIAPATVRWTRGTRVGLQFAHPVSVQAALTVEHVSYRDPRHRISRRAIVAAGDTYQVVNVVNVSRGGAQVEASLEPGRSARISIAGGPSLACEVRWTRDGKSGLMFTRPVDLHEFNWDKVRATTVLIR